MRLFVALNFNNELKKRVSEVQNTLKDLKLVQGSYPKLENLHFTVQFLGEIPENKVKNIENALSSITLPAFKVKLKGLGVFPSENHIRVIWIGTENNQMANLAELVAEKLKPLGYKPDYKFSAHLTLARVTAGKDKQKLLKFIHDHKNAEFGSFKADCFDLMSSKLSATGSKYEIIKKFQL